MTLNRPEAVDYIPILRQSQRLPVVLTREEVARLLQAAPGLKWRTRSNPGAPDGFMEGAVARAQRHPNGPRFASSS